MKKVAILILMILFVGIGSMFQGSSSSLLYAQSFELVNSDGEKHSESLKDDLEGHVNIKNISSSPKNVLVSITIDEIVPGHEVAVCTYFCFPYTSVNWVSDESFTLNPGESSIDAIYGFGMTVHCNPGGKSGTTRATFRFFDESNPDDFIDVPFAFHFGTTSINDISSKDFVVAYPNPTSSILSVYSETVGIESIMVYSITGEQILLESNILNNFKTLDFSSFAKGKYLMFINMADGSRKTQTVVVE